MEIEISKSDYKDLANASIFYESQAEGLGSFFSLVVIVIFQQYITRFQIIPEERALLELFPEQYHDYCKKARRWL